MAAGYHYGEMTWPEIKAAAQRNVVVVVPIATIEDHGPHLPIDTDLRLCNAVCEEAVSRAQDRALLVPAINPDIARTTWIFPARLRSALIR